MTQEELKKLLTYDPETGSFWWRIAHRGLAAGSVAGHRQVSGYCVIKINNRTHRAHRLAHLYMAGSMPENQIDHIDGNPSNNRWSNLRQATHSQNRRNSCRPRRNKSGFKGVSWSKSNKAWVSSIYVNGRQTYLGQHKTKEAAAAAYARAARLHFGEFARVA